LPDAAPVNLVTDKQTQGRVYVCTYPTMMGLIDEVDEFGGRRFGPGHFDLIIIDEAHRSVYQKYRAIFSYFDSFLVGLTATPKDDVDHNTYSLFELEDGVPTDAYDMAEAVKDKFLVPAKTVSVPLKFLREGIAYADRSDEEKERWDELEWDEESAEVPDRVEAQAVNKWLFNKDTVDKVLAHLMTQGVKVAGGDRLGKTIIFAKNSAHADYIQERFDANYPKLVGKFARVITFKVEYAQDLIDAFYLKASAPHLAISVDMLDTGIDVPEVVNLVFFKLVRSKTKFWQMMGRGTRLCPNLFGPGDHKTHFQVFDYCQNLEFFSENPETTDGPSGEPLGKRLFKARLELITTLESPGEGGSEKLNVSESSALELGTLRESLSERLREEVIAMNVDNFIVRPQRRWVEKYREATAWAEPLKVDEQAELERFLAGLPHELDPEDEQAKRFDLLLLNLHLALLKNEPSFNRLQKQVITIAGLLEERSAIPMVHKELVIIQEVQTDEWWEHTTVTMLETVRRRLRGLVRLIEMKARKPVFTDFEDELGEATEVQFEAFTNPDEFERFRAKARHFLQTHLDHIVIHKLRMNEPLTATDLAELERFLSESGVGSEQEIEQAGEQSEGIGLFVRSLVGLDREAAKRALGRFLEGGTATANQIEFLGLMVDHLTEHGALSPVRLYESPFIDVAAEGPESCFAADDLDDLCAVLDAIREAAAG
jgi:type I restriction enzyme R subunit